MLLLRKNLTELHSSSELIGGLPMPLHFSLIIYIKIKPKISSIRFLGILESHGTVNQKEIVILLQQKSIFEIET